MTELERKIPSLIGISGKIGSGKDTTADLVVNLTPHVKWVRLTFARKLKEIVAEETGLTVEELNTHEGKNTYCPKYKMTAGERLQFVGNGEREKKGEDVWINYVKERMEEGKKAGETHWLITDLREYNPCL